MTEVLFIFIALEEVTLVGLFVALVCQALWGAGRRRERQIRLWTKTLGPALAGRRHARSRVRRSLKSEEDIVAFQRFLHDHFGPSLSEHSASLRQLMRALGVTSWLHARFRKAGKDLDRASAARTLAYLGEPLNPAEVAELLSSKDPAAVLAAAHALTSLGNPSYFLPVFRAIYDRTPITLHGAAGLLSRFGPAACPTITRLVSEVVKHTVTAPNPKFPGDALPDALDHTKAVDPNDVAAQVVMIDLLAFFRYAPAAPILRELLRVSPHEEVVIHLVKALGALKDSEAIPLLEPLLKHDNWVIRTQAAKALAAIASSKAACTAALPPAAQLGAGDREGSLAPGGALATDGAVAPGGALATGSTPATGGAQHGDADLRRVPA